MAHDRGCPGDDRCEGTKERGAVDGQESDMVVLVDVLGDHAEGKWGELDSFRPTALIFNLLYPVDLSPWNKNRNEDLRRGLKIS